MPATNLEEEAAVVLPQRQPRLKRRRTCEADKPAKAEAPVAADADPSEPTATAAAAGGGGAAAAPADKEPQGAGAAAAAEGGDLDLPAYRSAVVPGQNFECASRAGCCGAKGRPAPQRREQQGVLLSHSIIGTVHPFFPLQT